MKRYKSFLFPVTNLSKLKIKNLLCNLPKVPIHPQIFNTTNLNTFYYLLGSKESINIFYILMGPQSCLPKAMKIKSKAASMGKGL